jgi:hypothetical protein
VRRDLQQRRTFATRGAQTPHVAMLQVTNATVHDFEAMRRGAGGEILPLNKRCAKSPQRRFARGGCACGTTTHDENVEAL